ncbi:adenylate/guanylate cyclase domain-containing protein [Rubripirellula obstinata]|nr:adenylate/guanylate cyclase domain-containing protein [Rubripirellula obstinata]
MPDLIAQGPGSGDRWRRELPDATSASQLSLGRRASDWNVPWDSMISRNHIRLIPMPDERIEVIGSPAARNPIFHHGQQTRRFTLVVGDHFVIGRTTFTLVNRPGVVDSSSDLAAELAGDSSADQARAGQMSADQASRSTELMQHSYDPVALRRKSFTDAASRIDMLSRLPDLIIGSATDQELLVRVTNVMLQEIPNASAVAVVQCDPTSSVKLLHYDSRTGSIDEPSVSARLVRDATKKRESVLNLWSPRQLSETRSTEAFTANESVDWAFCVPLSSDGCPGWAIYVSGGLQTESGGETQGMDFEKSIQSAPDDLHDDVKFTELVGTTLSNLRQSRRLQRRQAQMRHFFAPVVLDALSDQNLDEVLVPREVDLSVLFCDLRGFSRRSEQDSADLLGLLAHVSKALGVMTRHIMEGQGVIGDFHGDAAMGFWGWPLEQPDAAIRAVEAASKIRADFRIHADKLGFRCGIGVATGRAVAGQIGTIDQVKVTAFGPVVNLASRLEGMTKTMGAEVIVDEATANAIAKAADPRFQTRSLGSVQPSGFSSEFEVAELLSDSDGSLI